MRSIGAIFFCLFSAWVSAEGLSREDLVGVLVARLDVEGAFFVVQLLVNEDGSYNYREATISNAMPRPGCNGNYELVGMKFIGTLDCSAIGGPSGIVHEADFSTVTVNQLTSEEGAAVMIYSGLLESHAPFRVFKQDQPYFQD